MLQYEYARTALQTGLKIGRELGVNPDKFGMIGSTDSHTALATAEEENFFGKHSGTEPSPEGYKHPMAQTANGRYETTRRFWATRLVLFSLPAGLLPERLTVGKY